MFPEGLAVCVGQCLGRHVLARVAVALEVAQPDAADAQLLELVELAHSRERDPVVDLRDLVQRGRRVLRDEQDPVGVLHHDDRLAAADALPRVVGLVLHELLGRDVVRSRHVASPPLPGGGRRRCGSRGAPERSTISSSKRPRMSSSGISTVPDSEIATTLGKSPRIRSGPPVPTSSSAASNRASMANLTASSRRRLSR